MATSPRPSATSRARSSSSCGWAPRRDAPRRRSGRALGRALDAAGSELGAGRLGLRHPRLGAAAARCRPAVEVEQDRGEVDARDAVDERVVGLRDQREAGRRRAPRPATAPTAAWRGRAAGRRSARRASAACSRRPGAGSAVWRTWYSRLNVGSSTHSGRPVSSGGDGELLPVARDEVQPRADVVEEVAVRPAAALEQRRCRRCACASSAPSCARKPASTEDSRSRCCCATLSYRGWGPTWRRPGRVTRRWPTSTPPPSPSAPAPRVASGSTRSSCPRAATGRCCASCRSWSATEIAVLDPLADAGFDPAPLAARAGRPDGRGRAARRPPGRGAAAPRVGDGRHQRLRHPGRRGVRRLLGAQAGLPRPAARRAADPAGEVGELHALGRAAADPRAARATRARTSSTCSRSPTRSRAG